MVELFWITRSISQIFTISYLCFNILNFLWGFGFRLGRILPQKIMLALKVFTIDSKIITSLCESKSVTHSVAETRIVSLGSSEPRLKNNVLDWYHKCRDVASQRRQTRGYSESGAICEDDVTSFVLKTVQEISGWRWEKLKLSHYTEPFTNLGKICLRWFNFRL